METASGDVIQIRVDLTSVGFTLLLLELVSGEGSLVLVDLRTGDVPL